MISDELKIIPHMRRDYFLGVSEVGAGLKIGGFRLNFRQKMPLCAHFAYFSSK
jgi:hypothetical protein